jgi:hypothetical protein
MITIGQKVLCFRNKVVREIRNLFDDSQSAKGSLCESVSDCTDSSRQRGHLFSNIRVAGP